MKISDNCPLFNSKKKAIPVKGIDDALRCTGMKSIGEAMKMPNNNNKLEKDVATGIHPSTAVFRNGITLVSFIFGLLLRKPISAN